MPEAEPMRFSAFIRNNLDEIIAEWESFARTLHVATAMTDLALRDHCREILLAIAEEMETSQTDEEQSAKSKTLTQPPGSPDNAATEHGSLRHLAGFDPMQLVGEFRAMRASVLALWNRSAASDAARPALEEFTRFNEALDKALAESVEAYSTRLATSRDMFLAVLGHDLRSPLSVIDMSARLLGKPELPPAARDQTMMRIRRAAREMNLLITDLLEFTRTRLGSGIPIERSGCELGVLCEEAVDAIRTSDPQQRFDLQLSGDLNTRADPPRIRQILTNLLHNAVRYGSPNASVSVDVRGEPDAVVLKIANAGNPIPPEALQAIFEPLVQLPGDPSQPGQRSGTSLGLGLFIVREIVLGHDGTIAVASSADAGTVFTIRLPRG